MMNKIKRDYFRRDTIQVAIDLLGETLVRVLDNGKQIKGRIVETEAYLGIKDSCCHSFSGRHTKRTKTMYLDGGVVYVYFTYGMHHCFNIVTAKKGQPEAVLIRAVEPLEGIIEMQKNRKSLQSVSMREKQYIDSTDQKTKLSGEKERTLFSMRNLSNGPGKLSQAFNITRDLDGESIVGYKLFVEKGIRYSQSAISVSHRIGLSPHQLACYWPLRFYVTKNMYVSIKK